MQGDFEEHASFDTFKAKIGPLFTPQSTFESPRELSVCVALTFLTLFFEQTIEGRPAFRRTASRRHGKLKLDLNEKSFQCSKT